MSNLEVILRILLANLVVLVLPIILVVAGILLVIKARKSGPSASTLRCLGISFVALPLGVIVYTIAGIVAARIRGDGHFYGEPFGGYNVSSNAADLKSVLLWVGLLFLVLASLLRTRE